jgi:hypothetical protein
MDRIEDQVLAVVGTGVAGNDLSPATDDHLMDIAPDPDLLVTIGDGH